MNQEISQPPSPKKKKPAKSSGMKKVINLLLIVGIIAAVALFVWAEQDRRSKEAELKSTRAELERIQNSTQQDADEVARQVLSKVRELMEIPSDPQPTVATIVDVESLKKANEFYSVASNGDHLIITEKRAILYDPDRDIILDVVPVVIDENADGDAAQDPNAAGGDPAAEATPTATPADQPAQ